MRRTVNRGRRSFLKTGAAAGGGLVVGFYLPGAIQAEAAAGPAKLNAYVKVGSDNKVTFVCGQAEMGQGVHNGLCMMLAEELEVDLKNVHAEQGGIDPALGTPLYTGLRRWGASRPQGEVPAYATSGAKCGTRVRPRASCWSRRGPSGCKCRATSASPKTVMYCTKPAAEKCPMAPSRATQHAWQRRTSPRSSRPPSSRSSGNRHCGRMCQPRGMASPSTVSMSNAPASWSRR